MMREGIPLKVCTIGISDDYVEHGNVDVLRKEVGLDRESIVKKVIADDQRIKEEKKHERTFGCIACKEKSGGFQRKSKSNYYVRKCICRRSERR